MNAISRPIMSTASKSSSKLKPRLTTKRIFLQKSFIEDHHGSVIQMNKLMKKTANVYPNVIKV